MSLDLQKASMWKRISAYIFDGILMITLAVAFGWLLSLILGYDGYNDQVNQAYAKYYTICAAAAISEIPYHSAAIIRSDGIMIEGKVFDRRTNEAEPEEEE